MPKRISACVSPTRALPELMFKNDELPVFCPKVSVPPAIRVDPFDTETLELVLPGLAAIVVPAPLVTLTVAPFVTERVPLPLLPTMMRCELIRLVPVPSTETAPTDPDWLPMVKPAVVRLPPD